MKTSLLKISTFLSVIFLLSIAFMWTSCKKDKKTYGEVTVEYETGVSVGNAKVTLAAPNADPPGEVTAAGSTDGSGLAKFTMALPGIWDVTVTKDTAGATLTGTGILRLDEPGKHDDVNIVLR